MTGETDNRGESLGTGFLVGGIIMAVGVYVVSTARMGTRSDAESEQNTSTH
jgi:hypothetical protein